MGADQPSGLLFLPRRARRKGRVHLGIALLLTAVLAVSPAVAQSGSEPASPQASGSGVYVPPGGEGGDGASSPLPVAEGGTGTNRPREAAHRVYEGDEGLEYTGSPGPPRLEAEPVIDIDRGDLPRAALERAGDLSVSGADLREVLRALATEHDLNLVVDEAVDLRVTARLSDLQVIDVLVFFAEEYGLSLVQSGTVFRIGVPAPITPPPPPPPSIPVVVRDGRLTTDISSVPLRAFVHVVAMESGTSVVVQQGVEGRVSGVLQDAELVPGLRTLLAGSGFTLRDRDGILVVDRAPSPLSAGEGAAPPRTSMFGVEVDEAGRVNLDVAGASVADVLHELATQADLDLVMYQTPEGQITARFSALPLDEALAILFRRTEATFRREGELYVVGGQQERGVAGSRLLRLRHLRAEDAAAMLPEVLKQNATVQVVAEQNGIIVTGHVAAIQEVGRYLDEIDHPTPLVLIEALVVDFEDTDLFELGVAAGLGGEPGGERDRVGRSGSFGGTDGLDDGIRAEIDGRRVGWYDDDINDFFGVNIIGHLPDDFYLRIRALERDGRARVRSRPQIATLNGHTASLSVGTTQYYILRSSTPIGGGGGEVYPVETERFERIEANVSLEITPYVTASGEVTTEIKPEFSTPVGGLDPSTPPTINTRVLNSTVRLRDGETIILGGLIQESTVRTYNKIPLLGSIPILGRLFRNESSNTRKSELVVYLTPHVFYGDEDDAARWTDLRDRLGLSGEEVGIPAPHRDGF